MVEVNGNMVPPLGQGQQGERSITFEKVKDSKGKSVEVRFPSDRKKSDDGPKGSKLGDKDRRRIPWPGGYVSVDHEPTPTDAAQPCKATIYLHLTLAGKGCSGTDVETAMQRMEEGAKKLGGKCNCPPPAQGYEPNKNEGRSVEVVIIWHPESGAGVATVTLNCGSKPPRHGDASSQGGTLKFDGNFSVAEGPNVPANASLAAHEMGHLLFGTDSDSPGKEDVAKGDEAWNPEGHNPDPQGLMRDTEATDDAKLKRGDTISQKEVCILCNKADLKVGDCCTYKKKAKKIAQLEQPMSTGDPTLSVYVS